MVVWTVKGGRKGEHEQAFLENSVVCKWADMPDLSNLSGPEAIRELLQKSNPQLSEKQRIAHAGQFWSLVHRMQQGELVVLPLKTTGTIAVGEITGPYRYAPQEQPNLRHGRPVKWITTDLPRDAFAQDLLFSFGAFATVARVKRDQAEERIRAVIAGHPEDTATSLTASVEPSSEAPEAEESIDVREVAREEIRQFVSQTFAGHDLARLVGAVLEAQGFSVTLSPPGADQGVDILAGAGALGLDSPRIVVQVKTGQAGFEEFRSLRGLLTTLTADQGLLVAWRGFRGNIRQEARMEHFKLRLWDADALLDSLFEVYEELPEDIRTELPLQRLWALVPAAE